MSNMADIDMTDAPSGSSGSVKKATGKVKVSVEGTADGKKRFEVKKVGKYTNRSLKERC